VISASAAALATAAMSAPGADSALSAGCAVIF
jgi:hypothetical protein